MNHDPNNPHNFTVPGSVRNHLDMAESLTLRNQQGAFSMYRNSAGQIANASPELAATLAAAELGKQVITMSETETITMHDNDLRKAYGIPVLNFTRTKIETKTSIKRFTIE